MEAVARLNNYPTSPRKMRLLADLIRGMEVEKALGVLQYNPKHPATPLYKLLKSAINNWEQKNADAKVEDAGLIVKTIMVDGGRVIKRMRPAPQGRGYRIRKRSNHVTIIIDSAWATEQPKLRNERKVAAAEPVAETTEAVKTEEKPVKKETVKKAAVKKATEGKATEKKAPAATKKAAKPKAKNESTDKTTKK